jgi:hypothetical protein
MPKMSIVIANDNDREHVFAELYNEADEQWAEILQESDSLTITIFPNPNGNFWTFDVNDVVEIIQQAKFKLLGSG